MNRKAILYVMVLLAALASSESRAAQNFAAPKKIVPVIAAPAKTFEVGEKLVFDVYWIGVPVGVGELEIREKVRLNGRDAFHVVGTAKTNDFLSNLFPVHDEIHSWIDAETFHSLQFEKKISEGRYRADEKVVYDYPGKKGHYESFKNGTKKEFPLNGPAHDIVSAFYWFRLQDVRGKRMVETPLNLEGDEWKAEMHIVRQETRELRGKRVLHVMVVEPKTSYKGVFFKAGRAWVQFTIGPERMPVQVQFETPFGPVLGTLRTH